MGAWRFNLVVVFAALCCVAQTTITSPDGRWTVSVRSAGNGTNELWIAGPEANRSRLLSDKVTRFAFIKDAPNGGRLLVARRMHCFIEDLRQDCFPVLLLTIVRGNTAGGVVATGKMVAKDDAEFDELLQQLSR
jgi:hypothetical protein